MRNLKGILLKFVRLHSRCFMVFYIENTVLHTCIEVFWAGEGRNT